VSAREALSVTIFELAANHFSVSISKSTRTVCADQSKLQL
jgi:hypothetical protein